MSGRIYFDHSATTPLDPRVLNAMTPYFEGNFGNASSQHHEGRKARAAIDKARAQVAALLGADPAEIIFTASGTEADNLAILGAIRGSTSAHIITSAIEHPAVIEPCRYLERCGHEVTHLPVDGFGRVNPDDLRRALRPNTQLVTIMAANNIVGTVQPIQELAEIARQHGALFHTDAVQAGGKIPLDVSKLAIDLISLSAHKLHGPKGIGALYVRHGVQLSPIVFGGGQESGLRSATENVPGIVGFGLAAELARKEMSAEKVRLTKIRKHILGALQQTVPDAHLIGHPEERLPGHLCLGVRGLEREIDALVRILDGVGVAVSSGSACSAHHVSKPSAVLLAMGFDEERARGLLRVTLGRFNTSAEVERFLRILPAAVAELGLASALAPAESLQVEAAVN